MSAKLQRVHAAVSDALNDLAPLFRGGVKLTFVARRPDVPDGSQDLVITNDGLAAVRRSLTQLEERERAEITDRERELIAHMLGLPLMNRRTGRRRRRWAYRNYFCACPGTDDDRALEQLAKRGLVREHRRPPKGTGLERYRIYRATWAGVQAAGLANRVKRADRLHYAEVAHPMPDRDDPEPVIEPHLAIHAEDDDAEERDRG